MVVYLPGAGCLAHTLREELDAFGALIGALDRERNALLRADPEALSRVTEEKLAATDAVAASSRARRTAMARYRAGARVVVMPEIHRLTATVDATAGRAAALNRTNRLLLARYATRFVSAARAAGERLPPA